MAKTINWPLCMCGCGLPTDRWPEPPARWKMYRSHKKGHSRIAKKTLPDGRRVCFICKEAKPLEDFNVSTKKNGRKTRSSYCVPCQAIYSKSHRVAKYGSSRSFQLQQRYGITELQFEELRQAQGGGCAICLRQETRLCVDHCHSSKKIRGLLCCRCNTILGIWKDNPDCAARALNYLRSQKPVSTRYVVLTISDPPPVVGSLVATNSVTGWLSHAEALPLAGATPSAMPI